MTQFQRILTASMLTLAISTVSFGGTITGSRTGATGAKAGTITGSRTGTITGSRTGTITGSRVGTITGSAATFPASDNYGIVPTREGLMSRVVSLFLQLAW
jgi:hypothetical protein